MILLFSLAALLALPAAAQSVPRAKRAASPPTLGEMMDYGPFLSSSLVERQPAADGTQAAGVKKKGKVADLKVLAARAITVDVGNNSAVSFDTDTLRVIGGWTGGFLDLSKTHMATTKGSEPTKPAGPMVFSTRMGPGWAKDGKFDDPRPHGWGALPAEWAHYKGLYRHGRQVIFSYSLGDVDVLEMPGSVATASFLGFTRTIHMGKSPAPTSLLVCDVEGGRLRNLAHSEEAGPGISHASDVGLSLSGPDGVTHVSIVSPPDAAAFKVIDKTRVILQIPPLASPTTFTIVISKDDEKPAPNAAFKPLASMKVEDLPSLCHGGPTLWGAGPVTQGRRSPDTKTYVVDTITVPEENPWHSWMRTTALDFFSDGRCAICTWNGDVWIVSGIDANLQQVKWKRFATGLYEPLGLKIVNDQIYVLGRDQITRLHDLDGDGEADFYEDFNNGGATFPVYHGFKMDLQADSEGNFYYVTDGNQIPLDGPMHASVLKVSKDGKKISVVCTGLRAANGAGIGPNDEIVCADNQGNWTPVCRINLVKPGGFYGFPGYPMTRQEVAAARKDYDPPLCWIPYEKDNSSGGQVFIDNNKWGPLSGHMLSTSYGKCKLFEVMWEKADGMAQGATVELPLDFESGIQRARVNPADGQLYLCGLKGWQTSAIRDGGLQRVRYTGKPFYLPTDVHVKSDGIAITFDRALDPTTASDEQSYGIEQWNYKWSIEYGSKKYKPSDGAKVGTDEVPVKSAKLSADHKSVFLEIPNLHPVMQMGIQMHISAADGTPIECEVDETIHHVPGSSLPPVLSNQ